MDKTTKNIILSIILVLLIVGSYFTVNNIKDNKNNFDFNKRMIENNKFKDDKKEDETTTDKKEDTTVEDNNVTTDQNKPSERKRPSNFNRDNMPNMNFKSNNNKNLYIVLFGIESALCGAIILYLVILNTSKKEEKPKK